MSLDWNDTIVALSTPPGRGGIALIRISGDEAPRIAAALGAEALRPRQAKLCVIRDLEGRVLDRALATRFEPPATYTGEAVVEISCHGGALVPALVLDAACSAGARPAEPGEFTRRAYLNGKLDLIQAEATLDLIDATSVEHHRSAMSQLGGTLSERVTGLRRRLLDLQAAVGYDIDFPEEDDGPVSTDRILALADEFEREARELLRYAPEGERLRTGVLTVIAGRPNVGKSTIFNRLHGTARAIVTEVPGTTRDAIEADVTIDGFPFRLVDTAGIRAEAEPIEQMGIEIARGYLERADVVLLCVECGQAPSSLDWEVAEAARETGAEVLWLETKADALPRVVGSGEAAGGSGEAGSPSREGMPEGAVRVSGLTDEGLERLREALVDACFSGLRSAREPALVTRRRHSRALEAAIVDVAGFRALVRDGHPSEIASTHLQDATVTLEGLLGVTDVEDVLEVIFRSFCVGK